VPVRRRALVDGLLQVEFLDDDSRWYTEAKKKSAHVKAPAIIKEKRTSQVKVGVDDVDKLMVSLLARPVRVDVDRQRLRNTDSIRKLDQGPAGETGSHKRFRFEERISRLKKVTFQVPNKNTPIHRAA
jgi:hypothetical protein